jgi:hypothetical protein
MKLPSLKQNSIPKKGIPELDHISPRRPTPPYAKGFSSSGSGTDSSDEENMVKSLDND